VLLDLSPLLRGEHGAAIRVAGVRVSDAAANIERHALTGAEDRAPDEPGAHHDRVYRYSDDRTVVDVYRITPGGTEVEIPLAERIEAALQRGGVLRCGAIMLRVADGAIERIFVRGPSLASLRITREEDIAKRFGAAAGHERKGWWRVHHYPERGLAIAWHEEERRVAEVVLGAEPWHEPRLGAKELLTELVQAFEILFQAGETEPPDVYPRVRYQRAAALSRALGLGAVPDVVSGRFLDGELDTARRRVLEEVAAHSPSDAPPSRHSAALLFQHLLRYRRDVDDVVRTTAGWLLCSDPVLRGMLAIQNDLGRQLEAMMADVDRWLCTLMDPEHRTFELRDLIAHHGWPDIDLEQLES
jgi:hypothetical protein